MARELGAELDPVDRVPQRDVRREAATLLRCSRPTKCQTGAGRLPRARSTLATSSWARFSPKLALPAAERGGDGRVGLSFETATSVDASGGAAGCARGRGDPLAHRDQVLADERCDRDLAPAGHVSTATVDLPAGRAVAAVGEAVGVVRGAHAAVVELVDPALGERERAQPPARSSAGAPARVRPSTSAPNRATSACEVVGAELVALRADARAEERAHGAGADRAERARPRRAITPLREPRWPACTTPTASSLASTIGAQSAVTTRAGGRVVAVTAASASGGVAPARVADVRRASPCTWSIQTQRVGLGQPRRRRRPAPVLGDGVGIVADVVADVARVVGRARRRRPAGRCTRSPARPRRAARRAGRSLSAGTRGRRSRRRRGRARRRPRASPRRRDRACASDANDRPRRAARLRSGRSPAAMTVMRTSSPSASSMTAPKMMLASGCAAWPMISAASFSSNSPRSDGPLTLSRMPRAPSMLASSSGLEIAARAAVTARPVARRVPDAHERGARAREDHLHVGEVGVDETRAS